jgi:hypothetical protein
MCTSEIKIKIPGSNQSGKETLAFMSYGHGHRLQLLAVNCPPIHHVHLDHAAADTQALCAAAQRTTQVEHKYVLSQAL